MNGDPYSRVRCPDNKKYGFDYSKNVFPQLMRVLGLETQPLIFAQIRNKINKLSQEHLDVNQATSKQPESLALLQGQISRDIPEYFGEELEDIEKRKVFLYHTARYMHNNRRVEHLKAQRRAKCYSETTKVRPSRRSPSTPLRDSLVNSAAALNRRAVSCQPTSNKPVKSPAAAVLPLKRIRKPTSKAQEPSTSDRNSAGKKKKEFKLPQIPEIRRRHQTPSAQGSSISAPSPAVEARPKQASELDESEFAESSETSGAIVGLAAIRDFLSTCQPCMAHHYRHLVDVGCVNEQHLFSISTWDPDKRFETLKKMLPGLTPMDIMFMSHHFETYFGH